MTAPSLTREIATRVHRYAGLALAAFLVIAGLTGSLLAFYRELDALCAPALHLVDDDGTGTADVFAIREWIEANQPGIRAPSVPLHHEPGGSLAFFVEGPDGQAGETAAVVDDELFFHPRTGELLGSRRWGDLGQGIQNLMPFVYKLHYALAVPGNVGVWIFGIVALVWTFDCFVGFYLTLPRRRAHVAAGTGRSFWRRWQPAWLIRWRSPSFRRINFDVHRAAGLWLWVMFFVFAWSGVGLNLGDEVYKPVMGLLFRMDHPSDHLPALAEERPTPGIPWREAHAIARRLAGEQAAARGFTVLREHALGYEPGEGVYRYTVKTDRDVYDRFAHVTLYFDATSGDFRGIVLPSGQASGRTITNWLYALHFGAVFGLPYRIFVVFLGLAVTVLTASGVLIWWKKRAGRLARRSAVDTIEPAAGPRRLAGSL